jgi:hypothetical protein
MLQNAQPKPRPKLLDKYDRQRERDKTDREERAKCKARSGGQCEVVVDAYTMVNFINPRSVRCQQRAVENHHLIGGIGRRNQGRSILAKHRLDVCKVCHAEITNHVLVPTSDTTREDAATVRYERIR